MNTTSVIGCIPAVCSLIFGASFLLNPVRSTQCGDCTANAEVNAASGTYDLPNGVTVVVAWNPEVEEPGLCLNEGGVCVNLSNCDAHFAGSVTVAGATLEGRSRPGFTDGNGNITWGAWTAWAAVSPDVDIEVQNCGEVKVVAVRPTLNGQPAGLTITAVVMCTSCQPATNGDGERHQ